MIAYECPLTVFESVLYESLTNVSDNLSVVILNDQTGEELPIQDVNRRGMEHNITGIEFMLNPVQNQFFDLTIKNVSIVRLEEEKMEDLLGVHRGNTFYIASTYDHIF